jgi:hypothetical protein
MMRLSGLQAHQSLTEVVIVTTPPESSYRENIIVNEELQTKVCTYRNCPFNSNPQPLSVFCKSREHQDGFYPWCKTCRANYAKDHPHPYISRPFLGDLELRRTYHSLLYRENRERINEERRTKRAMERELKGCPVREKKNTAQVVKERWEKWKKDNPEFSKRKKPQRPDINAEYSGWTRRAVYRCKHRSADKDIPFNIEESDLNDIETGRLPVFCAILPYIRLDYSAGQDKRIWASVDRIEPKLGYVKGNVRVISMAANMAKSDGFGDILPFRKPKREMNETYHPSLFDNL